jgi:hypothetical protein
MIFVLFSFGAFISPEARQIGFIDFLLTLQNKRILIQSGGRKGI